ncbi:MAG: hypothetical protein ACI358_02040 [Candidatus Limimorpha sp.]
MNNTLNISRLWKVIRRDAYSFYQKFGLTITIMLGIPIGIWFINYITANIGLNTLSRYSILSILFTITIILAPARIYRECNDPRKGIEYAMTPASSLEKFISMLFYCIIVTPVIFWCGSFIIDTLLVLIPGKNPYQGFLVSEIFRIKEDFKELLFMNNDIETDKYILQEFKSLYSRPNIIFIYVLKIVSTAAIFMFGNMVFKKHKTSKTIGILIILFVIVMIVTIKITANLDETFCSLDKEAIAFSIMSFIKKATYFSEIIISIITVGLLAGTYYKIRKQRY